MSDFDPDAYLQEGQASSESFDPDAYLSQAPASTSVPPVATIAPPATPASVHGGYGVGRNPTVRPVSANSNATGSDLAQAAVSGINSGGLDLLGIPMDAASNVVDLGKAAIGSTYRGLTGNDIPQALQIEDRALVPGTSDWLKVQARHLFGANTVDVQNNSGQDLSALHTVGETAGPGVVAERIPARGSVEPIPAKPSAAVQAQDVVSQLDSKQSMGAASAAPRMTNVSPELQRAVVDAAQRTGGAVNPEVLGRHIEADSLPVKIQLTPGQASQDPSMISTEMNNRGRIAGLPDLLNEQNRRLIQNVQAIRDQVGPDVFSANPVEHGDTLIQAYKDKAAVADADINQKYQALRDANGGSFPVSAPTLLKNATSALNQELLLDHAPKSVMSTLGRLADDDNMTYQNFESLRTNLARISRSSTDGNERAAAGVIRSAMEELPLKPGAAELKPLADAARTAARNQFQALDADPAYKAAVNESVPPDRFVQKYVIGAPRDQLALMRDNLKDNETATQTMGVAALDHLRQSAGIDQSGNGTFSQAGFNKHLQALSPKLGSLLDPNTIEQLETLGNVARYTQAQPKGSFVNNSNTLVGALAGHAANAAEGMANVAAKGFPIGTITRKVLQNRSDAKIARDIMKPYGGLADLPEKPE